MPSSGVPFSADATCYSISVTNAASTSQALPGTGNTVRLVNEGPNHCYVHIATGSATATVPGTGVGSKTNTSTPVLAGSDITLTVAGVGPFNISAICAGTGTATLRVQSGEGI